MNMLDELREELITTKELTHRLARSRTASILGKLAMIAPPLRSDSSS